MIIWDERDLIAGIAYNSASQVQFKQNELNGISTHICKPDQRININWRYAKRFN